MNRTSRAFLLAALALVAIESTALAQFLTPPGSPPSVPTGGMSIPPAGGPGQDPPECEEPDT